MDSAEQLFEAPGGTLTTATTLRPISFCVECGAPRFEDSDLCRPFDEPVHDCNTDRWLWTESRLGWETPGADQRRRAQ